MMADSKSKKQNQVNINEASRLRDAEAERKWLKGNKTSTERDILAASKK